MSDFAVMPYSDYKDICDSVRAKTGGTEPLKSGEIKPLIDGIQAGGGEEVIYETDFVMDESITSNGQICTITTGISYTPAMLDNEILFAEITCEPFDLTVTRYASSLIQVLFPDQGRYMPLTAFSYIMGDVVDYNAYKATVNGGVGAYLQGTNSDLSLLTVYARFTLYPPTPGNYHLKIYRRGVRHGKDS